MATVYEIVRPRNRPPSGPRSAPAGLVSGAHAARASSPRVRHGLERCARHGPILRGRLMACGRGARCPRGPRFGGCRSRRSRVPSCGRGMSWTSLASSIDPRIGARRHGAARCGRRPMPALCGGSPAINAPASGMQTQMARARLQPLPCVAARVGIVSPIVNAVTRRRSSAVDQADLAARACLRSW